MHRNINLVFIFLLLSIYSMKKLKTTQSGCQVKKKNVSDMSVIGLKSVYIADDKLYYISNTEPVEVKGINPKHVETDYSNSFVIDTDDNLRVLTLKSSNPVVFDITPPEQFKDKFDNLLIHRVGLLAIRKTDGVIFKLGQKNELKEFGAIAKNITRICGNTLIFLYTNDNYLAFLNPNKKFAIEKLVNQRGSNIPINPNSELSCTPNAAFYGAKDDSQLNYYDVTKKSHFNTKLPIKSRLIGYKPDIIISLNEDHEWQECSNKLLKR